MNAYPATTAVANLLHLKAKRERDHNLNWRVTMNAYPATTAVANTFYFYTAGSLTPAEFKLKIKFGGSSFFPTPCTYTKRRSPISPAAGSVVKETTQSQQETPSDSVVRRLVLLRHAESSLENRSLRDHDRPLSKNGQADAVKLSQKLQLLGWIPELILSSDARRTRETLNIMQKEVRGFLEAEVHFLSSFYSVAAMDGQTAEHLQQAIREYSRDEILTAMCMGHNKGWEEAASMFSGVSVELKTCNAALLEAAGRSWEEAFALAGIGGWKLRGIVKPDAGH